MTKKLSRIQCLLILATLSTVLIILVFGLRDYFNKSTYVLLTRGQYFVLGNTSHSEFISEQFLYGSSLIVSSTSHTGSVLFDNDTHSLSENFKPTDAVALKVNSVSAPATNGYVLVTHFNEQLESSVYDLYQLTNIASTWRMQVVEPHIRGSQLDLHKLPSNNKTALRFRDIFNLTDANTMFQSCLKSDYSPIIPFEDFIDTLTHNPVMVVVLYLLRYSQTNRTCYSKHLSDSWRQIEMVSSYLRQPRAKDTKQHLRLFKIVCINTQEANNFNLLLDTHPTLKMAQTTAAESHSKLLILVPKWNGVRTRKDKFFYYDPSFTQKPCKHVHSIQHSSQVLAATNDYYASLNLKHPLLGVHVRLERTIRSGKEKPGHVSKCVKQFLEAAQTLMSKYHLNRSNAIAFRDYGPSGSITCGKKSCTQIAKELGIDKTLNSLGIRTLEYKPPRFTENAFVSSVEQELLSRADYLLTLGFGSFQASIVERFLREPGRQKDRLVAICPDR